MNKDQLIKHHFWILFGVAAVFIPLAFLLMWLIVSGAVSREQEAYAKQMKDLDTQAKSKGDVDAMEKNRASLADQRDVVWAANFARQEEAKVFEWPTGGDARLQAHNDKKYRFGAPFRASEIEMTGAVLEKAFGLGYEKLIKAMAPTKLKSKSALRQVTNWGNKPLAPRWVWLALEDYWVQGALLRTITAVNAEAARFVDVTPKGDDNPLKRKFRNRVWELDLEVEFRGTKPFVKGTLTNRTDRLQVVGLEKTMDVFLWLDNPNLEQYDFALTIRGETVPGLGKLPIEPTEIKNVPAVTRIAKAIQEFDEATVPVRVVNTIELSMLDHKNKAAVLEAPKHLEEDPEAALPADPGTGGMPGGMPGVMGEGGAPGGISLGGPGGMPGMMGGGGGGRGGSKSGTAAAVLNANRLRYLKRTEDVRRMPVAFSVIIDREYVNDLMITLANSPLRFQITQTQMQRYRGNLAAVGDGYQGEDPGMPGMPSMPGGAGDVGSPDGGDEEGGRGGRPNPGVPGGPSAPGGTGMPGGPFGSGPGTAPSGNTPVPAVATSGLVEFVVYGVVSLYEKKLPKPVDPNAPPADPNAPMGNLPVDPTAPKPPTPPTGGQPAAPAPMANTPMPPTGGQPMGNTPMPPMTPTGNVPAAPTPPMTPGGAPTPPPK